MTNEESSSKVNTSSNVDTPVVVTSEVPSVSKETVNFMASGSGS